MIRPSFPRKQGSRLRWGLLTVLVVGVLVLGVPAVGAQTPLGIDVLSAPSSVKVSPHRAVTNVTLTPAVTSVEATATFVDSTYGNSYTGWAMWVSEGSTVVVCTGGAYGSTTPNTFSLTRTMGSLSESTQYTFKAHAFSGGDVPFNCTSTAWVTSTASPDYSATFTTKASGPALPQPVDQTYEQGVAESYTLPAATTGSGHTYSLSPAPPAGMTFTPSTRVLAGTPTLQQAATTYTYTVTTPSDGTSERTFSITVLVGAPPLSLTVSDIGVFSAIVTLLNYTGSWSWELNGVCASATGSSVQAVDLTPGTQYTVMAYTSCGQGRTALAEATFAALSIEMAATDVTGSSAVLSLLGYTDRPWSVRQTLPTLGACLTLKANGTYTARGMFPLSPYTFTAYSDSECENALAASSFSTTTTQIRPPEEGGQAEVRVSGIFTWGDGFRFPLSIFNGLIDFEESPRGMISGALILGVALIVASVVILRTGSKAVALGAGAFAGIAMSYITPVPEAFIGLVLIMGTSVYMLRGKKW